MAKRDITFKEITIEPQHQAAFKKITDLIRLREIQVCEERNSNKCFTLENGTKSFCNHLNKKPFQINTKFGITDRALGKTKNSSI
jgi:hypothetical protein